MALGSTQPLVLGVFPGGKGGRCVRLTTLPPSCTVVMKSGNLNFQETSGPLQACNGTAFYLLLWKQYISIKLHLSSVHFSFLSVVKVEAKYSQGFMLFFYGWQNYKQRLQVFRRLIILIEYQKQCHGCFHVRSLHDHPLWLIMIGN